LLRSRRRPLEVTGSNGESGIELAYANWHCDPMPGEDRNGFANRSGFETESYIKDFPSSDAPPLFALVIDG